MSYIKAKTLSKDDFSQLIRAYRTKHKLTQAQLAYQANVNQHYVGQYESGKRKVTLNDFLKLMKAMGFDVNISIKGYNKEWEINV